MDQPRNDTISGESRSRFHFVGNVLAIDFVNTEVMSGDERVDLLSSFGDVVDWFAAAGVVSESQARELRSRWTAVATDAAMYSVRKFRETLRHALEGIVEGREIDDAVVDAINERLSNPVVRTRISRDGNGRHHVSSLMTFARPDDLLVPVAESARDLVCTLDLGLVKKCRNPRCILFFYDATKNHGRSWCSMSACGNREKVAAHYRRRRGSKHAGPA